MTFMLSNHFSPLRSAILGATVIVLAIVAATKHLLRSRNEKRGRLLALPHGVVLIIALLAFVAFLVEGALLDWSALLLVATKLFDAARAGIGYMLFSIAMTAGRLTGDRVVARLGSRKVFLLSGLLAVAGFALLLASHDRLLALSGFVLIGLGAANIVPILFRQAGNQRQMNAALAVAAATGGGYAGMLVGPALVGLLARAVGLQGAFMALALLMCLVPALYRTADAS
jgi:predicted MFS family arabinose efflux permease